jgi:hypothetical protein
MGVLSFTALVVDATWPGGRCEEDCVNVQRLHGEISGAGYCASPPRTGYRVALVPGTMDVRAGVGIEGQNAQAWCPHVGRCHAQCVCQLHGVRGHTSLARSGNASVVGVFVLHPLACSVPSQSRVHAECRSVGRRWR